MRIKIEPFLQKKGNRVAKGAIEFGPDCILTGFQLVGFTICDDKEKGLFVLFPSAKTERNGESRTFFFLRPETPELIDKLETMILDTYESMVQPFNSPKATTATAS